MAVPVISNVPPAPTRNDGAADFTTKADAMIGALQPMVVQINIALQWMNGQLTDTQASQAAAAASALAAAQSATAAANSATAATNNGAAQVQLAADQVALATDQVTLAAEQVGLAEDAREASEALLESTQVVAAAAQSAAGLPSLIGHGGQSLTVNPAGNGVVWAPGLPALPGSAGKILAVKSDESGAEWISQGYLHVWDQKAASAQGGTSVTGLQTRTLNTVVTNTLAGASLASNLITLPAGTYRVLAAVPATFLPHRATLYNVTTSAAVVVGTNAGTRTGNGATAASTSIIQGRFTLSATSQLRVNHFIEAGYGSAGLGDSIADGNPAIFTSVQIWKEF